MNKNTIYKGNCLDVLKTFPDGVIDCIITSPPYYQLRYYEGIPDYDWGDWSGQLGNEPTYQMYLEHLIMIMQECKRVLKDTGTMFINLGDSYAGSGNGSWNTKPEQLGKQKRGNYNAKYLGQGTGKSNSNIPSKSLMLIPHRFALRCIDELGLILRNDIIWAKPNGMPESVTDRFTKKHEFIFFFTKQQKYYFDLDRVRDKPVTGYNIINKTTENSAKYKGGYKRDLVDMKNNPLGKNPGDVSDFWDIPTKASNNNNHFAAYNSQLIDKPIKAGCKEGGIVLDIFAGTGTTLKRAYQLNRQFIGIEGSELYFNQTEKEIKQLLNQTKLTI